MSRPLVEVADLVRSAGTAFIERNRQWLRWTHLKVLLAIARCRTAALGGHIDECTRCGHRATISYNSCRNRHCPKWQTSAFAPTPSQLYLSRYPQNNSPATLEPCTTRDSLLPRRIQFP